MIKKYFMNRKQWDIEIENKLRLQSESLQTHWSEIMTQRIMKVKDDVIIEKDVEIGLLHSELKDKKTEISELKKDDFKKEMLKNEMKAKIEHLDYQSKLLGEVRNRISIQLGLNDSLIRDSEKLLVK